MTYSDVIEPNQIMILKYLSPKLKGADGALLTWIGTRPAVNPVTIPLCEGSGTVGRVRIIVNCQTRYLCRARSRRNCCSGWETPFLDNIL